MVRRRQKANGSGGTRSRGRAAVAAEKSAPPSRLQVYTANRILALIKHEAMERGRHLGEEMLAAKLGVSRTSVRGGLRILAAQGIVEAQPHRGYRLLRAGEGIAPTPELPATPDEQLYMRIVRDRLAGELPESATETELMRRYDAGRHHVLAALALLSEEGIVSRGKGREWRFQEMLSSRRALEESYEFRLMLEPSAIGLPTFRVDRAALESMRNLQLQLSEAVGRKVPFRQVFDTDAAFHELLATLSENSFVLSAVRRQNRLRRLLEYQSYLDAARVRAWCLEHIAVIDALTAGDRALAARHLRTHLENARATFGARARAHAPRNAGGRETS